MTPQELKYSIISRALSGNLTKEESFSNDIKIKEVSFDDETPFEVPKYWKWSNLGFCCDMYTGNSISESVKKAKYEGLKSGYDYIGTKDVSFEQTIAYNNGVRIPVNDGFKIAYAGSVLMCIEGGSAGRKIGILDRDVCFGNKLCMFNPSTISNKYLFYYLQSFEFKSIFNSLMTGIIGGVSIKKLKDIPIPIPPLAEQHRIVAKIEELLPYIDRYEAAYTRLEDFNKRFPVDMQKSILQQAIQGKLVEQRVEEGTGEELYRQIQKEKAALIKAGKIKQEKPLPEITEDEIPFEVPESWKWVRFLEVVQIATNLVKPEEYQDYMHIAPDNIEKGTGRLLECHTVKEDKVNSPNHLFHQGQLIYSKIRPLLKKVVVAPFDGLCSADMYPLETRINVYFLKYCILSACFNNQIAEAMSSRVKMPKINQKELEKIIIPLPPLAEQKRIVAKLEEILPLCDRLK